MGPVFVRGKSGRGAIRNMVSICTMYHSIRSIMDWVHRRKEEFYWIGLCSPCWEKKKRCALKPCHFDSGDKIFMHIMVVLCIGYLYRKPFVSLKFAIDLLKRTSFIYLDLSIFVKTTAYVYVSLWSSFFVVRYVIPKVIFS